MPDISDLPCLKLPDLRDQHCRHGDVENCEALDRHPEHSAVHVKSFVDIMVLSVAR